jgi:hypothetical protein
MNRIILSLGLVSLSFFSNAQAPNFEDLKILYADAKYEKLVKTAENYANKPELAEDADPYLYMSMGLYRISFTSIAEENPSFADARSAAFDALGSAMDIDKKGNDLDKHAAYIDEVQTYLVEAITNEIESASYTKAANYVKAYGKASKNAKVGAKLYEGCMKYLKTPDDESSAVTIWEKAQKMLTKDSLNDVSNWTKNDLIISKVGLIETLKYLYAIENTEMADFFWNYFEVVYGKDEEFMAEYEKAIK